MKTIQKILLTLCLIAASVLHVAAATNVTTNQPKLIFAVDLVRYGDRTAVSSFPEISSHWTQKEHLGQLTDIGKRTATQLGKKFHEYYVSQTHLLPKDFQPDAISVRSTDLQRTQETGRALLQGFYPAEAGRIKITVVPEAQDSLLRNWKRSEHKDSVDQLKADLAKQCETSQEDLHKRVRRAVATINRLFGTHFKPDYTFIHVADFFLTSKTHKRPLLEKLEERDELAVIGTGMELLRNFYSSPKTACITSKEFALHLVTLAHDQEADQPERKPKYLLYFAHDINIWGTASLLGDPITTYTPYLADLRFEMFESGEREAGKAKGDSAKADKREPPIDNRTFVRVSLDGKPLKVCASGLSCPTAEFVATVKANVASKCGN